MTESPSAPPSRLRWRCRRGMQELDVMLGRWLDTGWPSASARDREAFENLLGSEDDLLWDWLTGRGDPPAEFASIIEQIRIRTFGANGG